MNWGNGMDWSQLMQRFPVLGQRFQGQGPFAGHPAQGPFGQPSSGYDSSGINPHGMYNGAFGQPQFPHNPGGFQPMGLLARLSAYR